MLKTSQVELTEYQDWLEKNCNTFYCSSILHWKSRLECLLVNILQHLQHWKNFPELVSLRLSCYTDFLNHKLLLNYRTDLENNVYFIFPFLVLFDRGKQHEQKKKKKISFLVAVKLSKLTPCTVTSEPLAH